MIMVLFGLEPGRPGIKAKRNFESLRQGSQLQPFIQLSAIFCNIPSTCTDLTSSSCTYLCIFGGGFECVRCAGYYIVVYCIVYIIMLPHYVHLVNISFFSAKPNNSCGLRSGVDNDIP